MSSVPALRREDHPAVRRQRSFRPILLLLPTLALAGCAVGDFIGAYFNTYYNARRAFTEAEAELLKAPPAPLQPGEVRGYLPPYNVPATAKTKFVTVIEKSSKLLQYHPESAFVDDALLMIGKAYYYQNEHQQAERKFRELLDRFAGGDLAFEARLLLVNTLYRARDYDAARTAARSLEEDAEAAGEDRALAGAAMLLAHLALQARDTATALVQFDRAAEAGDTDEIVYAAWFASAEVFAALGRPGDALRAYRRAESTASTAAEEYRARIGGARMLSRLGEYDAAVGVMEDLLDLTANREFFAEIDFEIANTYREQGDLEAALRQYRYVDTAHVRTEFAARAGYAMGEIYENRLSLYDSARSAYQRARSLAGQSAIAPVVTRKAETFTRYFTLRMDLARQESLKILIVAPPESLLAALDSVRAHADSLLRMRRDSLAQKAPPPDSLRAQGALTVQGDSLRAPSSDSLAAAVLPPGSPDSLEAPPPDSLTAALLPAGRADSLRPRPPDSLRASLPDSARAVQGDSAAAPRIRPPLVNIPLDTIEARIAFACSELGSLFFTGIERRDSAVFWFHRLLNEYPGSPHTPRALYALAQMASQESSGAATADSIYRVLADRHVASEFGMAAARRLAIEVDADTEAAARGLYKTAEQALLREEYRSAIRAFRAVRQAHPASPYAARAEYAIGWIYERGTSQPESALATYRRVLADYPQSEFAGVVRPRLAAVDQYLKELEALAKAARDSAEAAKTAPPEGRGTPPGDQPEGAKEPPGETTEPKKDDPEKKEPPPDIEDAPPPQEEQEPGPQGEESEPPPDKPPPDIEEATPPPGEQEPGPQGEESEPSPDKPPPESRTRLP